MTGTIASTTVLDIMTLWRTTVGINKVESVRMMVTRGKVRQLDAYVWIWPD